MSIRKGVWYSHAEVAKFRDDPSLAGLVMEGYVLQQDPVAGRVRFVHWSKAGMDMGEQGNTYGQAVEGVFDKRELPAIVKRTPQQRLESLLSKVGDDLHFLLSGEEGHEVSGEQVRLAAQDALQTAETEFEKSEYKRFVRTTGNPYA